MSPHDTSYPRHWRRLLSTNASRPAANVKEDRLCQRESERALLREKIEELCLRLELKCVTRERRGLIRGGITAEVTGRPGNLDVFAKGYAKLLYARAEELMDEIYAGATASAG